MLFTPKRRKNQQTKTFLKKSVDGENEKQFNTPRLQDNAVKARSLARSPDSSVGRAGD